MIKIFESVIFVSILQKLAILLFIAVFLAAVWAKGRIGKKKMNGEQWEEYFRSLSNRQFVVMFFVLYLPAIFLTSAAGYGIYTWMELGEPFLLAALTFLFGVLNVAVRLDARKKELWNKIRKLGE